MSMFGGTHLVGIRHFLVLIFTATERLVNWGGQIIYNDA